MAPIITSEGTSDLAAERVSTAPAGQSGPAGQAIEPRYGSIAALQRLRFIDDARDAAGHPR